MRGSRLIRNIRLGIKNLLIHKLRSALTVLGMVFGVGSVIAMLSIGEGASREAMDNIRKLGSNNIIIRSEKPVEQESPTANTSRSMMITYGLTYDDLQRIRETISSVARAVPGKIVRKNARLGERSMELRLVGTTPDWFDLVARNVIAGRVLTWRDLDSRAAICVLTEFGARKLLATENTVGQYVRIANDYYKVIGLIQSESVGGSISAPDQEVDAYIPLDVAKERYGDIMRKRSTGSFEAERVELHMIVVEVDSPEHVEAAAEAIRTVLARFHKNEDYKNEDYKIQVPLALLRQAERTKRTMNIVLGSIAGISLLVGGIGIMNIMLATVTERTREIGIRRAIGAKRRQIIMQFLIETTVLASIGGLIGIGVGVFLPWVVTYFFKMPTVVQPWSIMLSLGISVSVGMIFGIYPAVRAAGLDPIVALRHE